MSPADRFRALTCTENLRANLGTRSVRATFFTAASGFADFAIRLGSTAILARLITPDHFGLVMMASAIIAVADQLRELGLSSATVQQPTLTHEQVSNLFWINVGVGAVLALTLCAASPAIAAYYHDPRLVPIACLLGTTLLAGGLTVQHQALLTRQLKLGHTATLRLASSVLSTVLCVALAYWDFGYWSLLWREVARAAFLAAGMWLCFPWIPGLPSLRTNVRPLLRFGAHLTSANLLSSITAGLDRFLLGHVSGPAAVGHYRQAFQLVAAPTDQLLSPIYQVAQPSLSLLQNDPARYARLYTKVLTLVCLLTMPLSLFVAVQATEITLFFLGPVWLEAAPLLCVLSLGTFVKQAAGSTAFVSITRGHSRTYLRLTVLHNAALVAAMLLAVRFGALGIACADVAVTWLLVAPRIRFSLTQSPISFRLFVTTAARPAFASLAMAFVLLLLPSSLPVAALLAVATFAATWLLLPGGRTEASTLLSDLRAAFQRTAPLRPAAISA